MPLTFCRSTFCGQETAILTIALVLYISQTILYHWCNVCTPKDNTASATAPTAPVSAPTAPVTAPTAPVSVPTAPVTAPTAHVSVSTAPVTGPSGGKKAPAIAITSFFSLKSKGSTTILKPGTKRPRASSEISDENEVKVKKHPRTSTTHSDTVT